MVCQKNALKELKALKGPFSYAGLPGRRDDKGKMRAIFHYYEWAAGRSEFQVVKSNR
jgi:hypothetical protein